jgi:hypothetical protein
VPRKKKLAAKFENKENKEKSKVTFDEWALWLETECHGMFLLPSICI